MGPPARIGPRPYPFLLRAGFAVSRGLERAVRVATTFVSHTLSAAQFTCGVDPKRFYHDYFAWQLSFRSLQPGLAVEVDSTARETSSSVFGLARRTVRHTGAFGTVSLNGLNDALDAPGPDEAAVRAPGPISGANPEPRLSVVLDEAVNPPVGRARSKALLVVRDGAVIAEAYAPGYGPATPMLGFSLTKALANAAAGRLVEMGMLDMDEPNICEEWRRPGDPRAAITPRHLLCMTSGLDFAETHTGFDPVSRMLFLSGDMGACAAEAPLVSEPGAKFVYTSGNTILLARLLRDRLGGAANVWRFLDRELFAPLGIERMCVDYDASGTPVLSTFCYATTRDWARLGHLFLDDGCAGSRRLLPRGWVARSTEGTAEPSYGAALRLSREGLERGKWILPGFPPSTYFAHGHLGQYVVVIPEWNSVIVRLGTSPQPLRAQDKELIGAIGHVLAS